jgi:RNA polymerase sigma-70 factor, ECF subfamily
LGEWMRRYTPRLLPIARAFAEGPDEAEDILQDVWIRAAQRVEQLGAQPDIGAWLFTVTLNEGRSRMRRRRRQMLLRSLRARDADSVRGGATIGGELARRALWRAVAALPALQRDVLLLRVVSDFSTGQAAAALGRAEGTVKASLFRALRSLRVRLGDDTLAALESHLGEYHERS